MTNNRGRLLGGFRGLREVWTVVPGEVFAVLVWLSSGASD